MDMHLSGEEVALLAPPQYFVYYNTPHSFYLVRNMIAVKNQLPDYSWSGQKAMDGETERIEKSECQY